jgi:hypothetical protein
MKFKKLFKTKTFWTGVAGIITAVGACATGEMELQSAAQMAVTSLLGIFIRHGMVKKG